MGAFGNKRVKSLFGKLPAADGAGNPQLTDHQLPRVF